MIKKIILCICASASTLVFAQGESYVGGSLGTSVNEHFPTSVSSQNGVEYRWKYPRMLSGKVFAGYGKRVGANNQIYTGGEFFGGVNKSYSSSYTVYNVGASFIPGYMLTDNTMLYGRVGAVQSSNSYYARHTGLQLGAGVQTKLANNWDVRGEYTETSSLSRSTLFFNGQLNMGLVYKFK